MHTNAYKGGREGLNMTKNTHLYAGLLKILQYLKHLRLDNSDFCLISLRFTFWMISLMHLNQGENNQGPVGPRHLQRPLDYLG